MKYLELLEADAEHVMALQTTGYWGKQAAGALILCTSTGRVLLPLRSQLVEQPGTWGTWGGAIDGNEEPEEGLRREIEEELHITEDYRLVPLYVFKDKSFRYYNFLLIVENEFEPSFNWETSRAEWFALDSLPNNLHFGLKALLADPTSAQLIQKFSHQ